LIPGNDVTVGNVIELLNSFDQDSFVVYFDLILNHYVCAVIM